MVLRILNKAFKPAAGCVEKSGGDFNPHIAIHLAIGVELSNSVKTLRSL